MPLASWVADLQARVTFMQKWAFKGHPDCFWLSGFFFPHGFMTGTLQTHARKFSLPIDTLAFDFTVMKETDVSQIGGIAPEEGIYIYGLYIQSARWSEVNRCLVEEHPGVMHS